MRQARVIFACLALVIVGLAATDALACPACAMRESATLTSTLILLSMIVLPFSVAALVIRALRRADADDDEDRP